MDLYLVALGGNSGRTVASNARSVARAMRALPGRVVAASALYRTSAWPPGAGPDFVNAVAVVAASMPPAAMLARLHRIEARAGRTRGARWGARVLDLDVLARGARVRPDVGVWRHWSDLAAGDQTRLAPERLILPHPRLADRAFVLVPLCDVAPGWRHPITGRTARAMLSALPARDRAGVRRIAGP